MIVIMWARVCIVLHNLIIRIEGDNFDERWRDSIVRRGLDLERADTDSDEGDELEDDLERAWR